MEKRDILDYLGNTIGVLEEPSEGAWTEEQWQKKLAVYAAPPASATIAPVTPRQMRQAMVLSGISMNQVEQSLATLPEPQKSLAQIEWEYSTLFIRSNPLVSQVGAIFGMSPQQLDDLWRFAATL